jgi:hypothetical protein
MDMICSQYGWTVAQVFEHTRDQVMELAEAINKRKNEDIKFTAAIHGAEMKDSRGKNTLDLENDIDKLGSIGINVAKG